MSELSVDVIDKILELAEPHRQTIGEIEYCDKKLYQIDEEYLAEAITTGTLSSLVSYIKEFSDTDGIDFADYMIYIESPRSVKIISKLTSERKREVIMNAFPDIKPFAFGQYHDNESFIIGVKSRFVDDPGTDKNLVIQFAGTVTQGTVKEYGDDGITQRAQIKTGITTKQDAVVPSPCTLRPFRTFIEVEQPASEFVFRMREGRNGVESALFSADGDMWCIEAMKNIKKYLEDQFEKEKIVGMTIIM